MPKQSSRKWFDLLYINISIIYNTVCFFLSTLETTGWRSLSAPISVVRQWSWMKIALICVSDSTTETSLLPMSWRATGCSMSTPTTLAASSSCVLGNTGGTSSGAVQVLPWAPCDVWLTSNEDLNHTTTSPNVSTALPVHAATMSNLQSPRGGRAECICDACCNPAQVPFSLA